MGGRAIRVRPAFSRLCSLVLSTDWDVCTLRSYDAAEDNELSFKEGDRITQIEAASDDWWQGTDLHGNVGLFPGMFKLCARCRRGADRVRYDSELRGAAGLRHSGEIMKARGIKQFYRRQVKVDLD